MKPVHSQDERLSL